MRHANLRRHIVLSALALTACGEPLDSLDEAEPLATERAALTAARVPALVMGLQHNQNQTAAGTVMFSARGADATHRDGGDLSAGNHRGFEWWSLPDQPSADPGSLVLPPAVVIGLKHNVNQSGQSITAFGHDAPTGADFPGYRRQSGGDRGGSSGQGFYWYESTGAQFSNWASIDALLPKFTVVGLKHSLNQASKVFVWNGVTYDPVKTSPVPPGFRRVQGGDLGAPSGQGYYWYEKTTGEEIVSRPTLASDLGRSLFLGSADLASADRDNDCLVDALEDALATTVRPLAVFDSSEHARRSMEPVTLYHVYPIDANRVHIRYEFVFEQDGGYGPAAGFLCTDAHGGDTDVADYDLTTSDQGRTWQLTRVAMSDDGKINWPSTSRLEVFEKTFPIVYLSGSKHHEYLTRDNDGKDSAYSSAGCNDDVDGAGARILVASPSAGLPSNNVGEFAAHPASRFANDLPMFSLPENPALHFSVWDDRPFHSSDAGPIDGKFKQRDGTPVVIPACANGCGHNPCTTGVRLTSGCFAEVAGVCALDPFCCNNSWDSLCVSEVPSGCNRP